MLWNTGPRSSQKFNILQLFFDVFQNLDFQMRDLDLKTKEKLLLHKKGN